MVNTSLRCPSGNYAWLKALVHPRPLGGSLCADRHLHVRNYFGAISHDHISTRDIFIYERGLVANRRPGTRRDADGTGGVLGAELDRAGDALPLFARKEF